MSYSRRRARDEVQDDPAAELRAHLRRCLAGRDLDDAERLLDDCLDRGAADNMEPREYLGPRRSLEPRGLDGEPRRVAMTGSWTGGASDLAMDAAPASAAGQRVLRQAVARCASILGEDAALRYDTAEEVMRVALLHLGYGEAHTVHRSALPALLAAATRSRSTLAADSVHGGWSRPEPIRTETADRSFRARFPSLSAVRSLG